MPVAGVTSSLTSLIGDHGVYAVFLLMIVAAVLPAASELTMLYAGAVAAGAFPDAQVVLFGHEIKSHGGAYVVMSLAGLLGNLVGAVGGWSLGMYAERISIRGARKAPDGTSASCTRRAICRSRVICWFSLRS